MSFQFTHLIDLRGKSLEIKELSFTDYKNICKALYSQTNSQALMNVFNGVLNTSLVNPVQLNVYEKVLTLIKIRAMTLGTEIKLTYNGSPIMLNTNYLIEKLDTTYKPLEYKYENFKLVLDLPYNFIVDQNSTFQCISECITEISTDNIVIPIHNLTEAEKGLIMQQLPSMPIVNIFSHLINHFKVISITIPTMGNFELNLFDETFLHFLKFIFDEGYETVLDLEYNLRKHLNFSSNDLSNVSYPETKIMLNKLTSEMKTDDSKRGGNMNEPT